MVIAELEQQLMLLSRRFTKPVKLHGPSGYTVLDRQAYAALARVHDEGPLRITTLAGLLDVDLSVASRQVKALEDTGFVQRVPDPADARAALVSATEVGRGALKEVRAKRREVLIEVLDTFVEGDQQELVRLLAAFNTGLDEVVTRRNEA